jgi:hypothetical protein
MAPPVKGKTSPLVWILLAVVGIVVLGIVALVGTGLFVARSVARNPGLVLGKLITAGNPNAEVVSTDTGSQTMRIRDKRTGKEVTISFDDIKNGKFKMSATGDDGEVATVEIGQGAGQLPKWVPTYPGAKAQGNFTAKGESSDGMGEGGMVSFSTSDPASKVISYYEGKCKEMGMKVDLTGTTADGGMILATDEAAQRTVQIMVGGGNGSDTTIAVTFGRKR